jgi:hypothetical protein
MFVLALGAAGSRVAFSHLFGKSIQGNAPGAVLAEVIAIRLDKRGGRYLVGNADGTAFPTTPSAYLQAPPSAGEDVFVFKTGYRERLAGQRDPARRLGRG